MSQLTDFLRRLINDAGATDFTDDELQVRLNKHRSFINETIINTENEDDKLVYIAAIIGWDGVSIKRIHYMNNVVLESAPGTAIPGGEITSQDEINGVFFFNTEQDNVYLSANYYDVFDTAADIWEERIGLAPISGKAKVGDEDIPKDVNYVEFCEAQVRRYRRSSSGSIARI